METHLKWIIHLEDTFYVFFWLRFIMGAMIQMMLKVGYQIYFLNLEAPVIIEHEHNCKEALICKDKSLVLFTWDEVWYHNEVDDDNTIQPLLPFCTV